jgi:hypothetical protein
MFALPPPASSLISPARPPAREQFFSPAINQSIIRARVNTSLANNITATLGLLSEREREGERGWQIDFLHLPRYFLQKIAPTSYEQPTHKRSAAYGYFSPFFAYC